MQFKTKCACCGKQLFLSKANVERLKNRSKPPLCIDCDGIDIIAPSVAFSFDPIFDSDSFQQRLPIEAIAGMP